jgi:hypothetical protein
MTTLNIRFSRTGIHFGALFWSRYTLCARFALDRNLRPSSELDANIEFVFVEGESPSFFRRICEAEKPPVDDKGEVVYPGPLNRVDHADPRGTAC